MPILEALGRLCREPGGERLIALLTQHAPMWLVQMPTLLNAAELERLQRQTQGATRERMLRELGEAVEVLTAERPLVLWLEDLHWSDASTLELLALLARQREPARLLVIGTYRPADVIVQGHPLRTVKQELQLHGLCAELPLGLLSERQVAEYLATRFQVPAPAEAGEPVLSVAEVGQGEGLSATTLHNLARLIHRRTDGNPLFMVTVVDDLLSQRVLVSVDGQWALRDELTTIETRVPDSLQQLIAQQIERLSTEDRLMLEVASVEGMEFSAAAIAVGIETATELVEERCEKLARQAQFLRAQGTAEWPDGTVAARYSFLHALYQEVLYERIPAGRRQRLHQQIGEREEQAYGKRAREIAAALAVHFEHGRDYGKAVQYLQLAGENAVRRSAHQEAISLLSKGLELLKLLSDTPERAQQELRLLKHLGPALISEKGFTAVGIEHTYARAYDLCRRSEDLHELIYVLQGMQIFHLVRGEVRKARALAEQGFQLAQRLSTPTALLTGHAFLVEPLYFLGELTTARAHLEEAWGLYNPQEHNLDVMQHWMDPGVGLLSYLAVTSWLLGYSDQAQQRLHEGLVLAERLSHPYSSGNILIYASLFHSARREWQQAREQAEEVIRLSTEYGFPYLFAQGTVLRGRALVVLGQVEEGLGQMQQGLTFFRSTGAELARLNFLPGLASAYARVGRVEEGLAVLAEALTVVDNTGMRLNEAGLYVMKGELLLNADLGMQNDERKTKRKRLASSSIHRSVQSEAEACFLKAVDIARKQQAKSLELRAVMSLSRLWQQQDKKKETHKLLSEIYTWFTEGFDTKDLQEAKVLLEQLT
jgi:predicted ATPase